MQKITLRELVVPFIKAIDSFNYLFKDHHRHTAIISYYLGTELKLNDEDLKNLVVAASIHDIGASTATEMKSLLENDIDNPTPHCQMGYRMLKHFHLFAPVADIVKCHHLAYSERDKHAKSPFACYIVHLADRIDVLMANHTLKITQKPEIIEYINSRCGTVFHPDVCKAFNVVVKKNEFWNNIQKMTMEELFERINLKTREPMDIDSIIDFTEILAKMIDFRSQYTYSHSYTVAELAYQMGKIYKLNEEKCKKLKVAGYLHDIGKIGVDPAIYEKKEKLTSGEVNKIKLHTYYTEKILNELVNTEWFKDIISWAVNHHERINGSGYPYGISGSEFTLEMKILAMSDIITALMEDRPYRKGLKAGLAFTIIEKEIADTIDPKMYGVIRSYREDLYRTVDSCKLRCKKNYEEHIVV